MLALDKTVNARPELARSGAGFPLGGALGGGGGIRYMLFSWKCYN